jgi:hypothetical protein
MRKTNASKVAAAAAGMFLLAGVGGCGNEGDLGALGSESDTSGVAAPCTADPSSAAIASVVIDGKSVAFEGLCVRGSVVAARVMGSKLPAFTAVGESPSDRLYIELNPDRLTATQTCDGVAADAGMRGSGLISFQTANVTDAGKPAKVVSQPGGTFLVRTYSTVVGTHIAGAFDCPTSRGWISGSFNVRLE